MAIIKRFGRRSQSQLNGAVIGIGNHKGGVGKSTVSVHLASAFAENGYRTLLIDLDPTGGATRLLGIDPEELAEEDVANSSLDLFLGHIEEIENSAVVEDLPFGMHFLPSVSALDQLDISLGASNSAVDYILRDELRKIRKHYDVIVLDTPPQPGSTILANAYNAAQWFLLSVTPARLSIEGLSGTVADLDEIRYSTNSELEIAGVVFCRVKRNSTYWKEVVKVVQDLIPGRVLSSEVSDTVEVERLSDQCLTAFEAQGRGAKKVAKEFRSLAEELLSRISEPERYLAKISKLEQRKKRANQ